MRVGGASFALHRSRWRRLRGRSRPAGGALVRDPLGHGGPPRDGRCRAPARGPGRDRRAQARWRRRGRRDRGQRRARLHGAGVRRPRRRPLRHGLGPGQRKADRPQRLGPRPAGADVRQGPAPSRRHDPAVLAVLVDRPGLRRRLVRAAHTVRPAADEGPPGAGDRVREGGRPGAAGDRRLVGARRSPSSRTSPGSPRSSSPAASRRPRASRSPTRPSPTPSSSSAAGGRDAYYRGEIRREDRGVLEEGRRLLLDGGLRPPHHRVAGADLHDVSRHHGLGAAAQRPGAGGAGDAQHPRALRPRGARPRQPRLLADHGRGQEARVRRPGALLRRPRLLSGARSRRSSTRGTRRSRRRASTCGGRPGRSSPATRRSGTATPRSSSPPTTAA